jgi:FtsP/CotA-like multicopper oxidase with cupredoxin domain
MNDTTVRLSVTPVNASRRETLSWAFGLSLGSVMAGCGGGGSGPATADTLPEPEMLTSTDGKLDMDLSAQYATQSLDIAYSQNPAFPGVSRKVSTTLRSFNGRYMAPTLYLNVGDTLRINLKNQLPSNGSLKPASLSYLNHQNSTNLHFHGLHVDPRELRPGVFGDYVVDTAEAGVLPGQNRQHEIYIPLNHTNGIYWYHPHLHGSSNVQVSSGMFGAIIIRDPKDQFVTTPDIRERVIHVHKVTLTADGKTETFYDSVTTAASAFLLNGAYQPTIVMRPGEVQNWHFINTASFYPFNPVMDGHTLQAYAKDGNVFAGKFKSINQATSVMFDDQSWPGNALYPGNRHSLLVQASLTPGTYYLRSVGAPFADPKEEIVARMVVEGSLMTTAMPLAVNLPRYSDHIPITDEELAENGGIKRNLVLAILNVGDPRLAAPIPAGEDWFIPESEGINGFENSVFASGSADTLAKLAPFQSSLTTTQTVALNAVEEWTINNANDYPHPFHIHINDSYVVKVNGVAVTPFWGDTLPVPAKGSITFRMRFTDFVGKYVWHCHALDHEDLGMMQLVEVVGTP